MQLSAAYKLVMLSAVRTSFTSPLGETASVTAAVTLTMATGEAVDLTGTVYSYYYQKQIIAALYACISALGTVGNTIVLLSGLLSLQPRTKTNVFVFNMAVADLACCLTLPANVMAMLGVPSAGGPPVPPGLCTLSGYMVLVSAGCSVNNIACVALYRALITIGGRRPLLMSLFTPKGLVVMVCLCWFIPMATAFIPILTEYGAFDYDLRINTCSFSPASKGGAVFSKIMSLVFYPTQLVVTFTSYTAIFIKVRKHLRSIRHNAPEVTGSTKPPASQGQGQMSTGDGQLSAQRVSDGAHSSRPGVQVATINPPLAPPPPPDWTPWASALCMFSIWMAFANSNAGVL